MSNATSTRTRVSHGRRLAALLEQARAAGLVTAWRAGAPDPDGLGRLMYAIDGAALTPGDALAHVERLIAGGRQPVTAADLTDRQRLYAQRVADASSLMQAGNGALGAAQMRAAKRMLRCYGGDLSSIDADIAVAILIDGAKSVA